VFSFFTFLFLGGVSCFFSLIFYLPAASLIGCRSLLQALLPRVVIPIQEFKIISAFAGSSQSYRLDGVLIKAFLSKAFPARPLFFTRPCSGQKGYTVSLQIQPTGSAKQFFAVPCYRWFFSRLVCHGNCSFLPPILERGESDLY